MIDPNAADFLETPASPRRPDFGYHLDGAVEPAVSVVTPYFNTGAIFHETARSLFRQSFQNWEWIIVNDGSTDAAAIRVLDEYRGRDARIRVLDQTNGGPGKARNAGVKAAVAPYVVYLDSDDLLEPTAIEKWVWYLECRPAVGFVKSFDVGFGAQQYLWTDGFHSGAKFLQCNHVQTNCMIRRALHDTVGGFDEQNRDGLEDWDYWLKLASHGFWGDSIPEYLTWYRRSDDHLERWTNWRAEDQFRAILQRRYPALWEEPFPCIPCDRREYRAALYREFPYSNPLKKSKKRLLMLVPHLEMGGADKFNLDLLRSLVLDHGYEVSVVATLSQAASWGPQFTALTPDVFVLQNFLRLDQYLAFLVYLVNSRAHDVVCVTNSALGYQLLPALRERVPHVPVVDYIHMEEEYWKSGGYGRFSVDYQPWLNRTVVSSRHLKDWLIDHGRRADDIHVCYTNIDPQEWSRDTVDTDRVRQKWDIEPDVPVILFAGRICAQKNPQVLGDVLCRLEKEGTRFQAFIAGSGEDLPWLSECFGRQEIRQTRLLGTIPLADIHDLLAVTDIYFLPSMMEGIALSIYEAMSMGVVPVGADVGGQRELVTPECGYLYDGSDDAVDYYSNVLRQLLTDPDGRTARAAACRKRIETHFNLEQMGLTMSQHFEDVIVSAKSRAQSVVMSPSADLWALEIVDQAQREREFEAFWFHKMNTDCRQSVLVHKLARELAVIRNSLTFRMARQLCLITAAIWGRIVTFPHQMWSKRRRLQVTIEPRDPTSGRGAEVWLAGLRHDGSHVFTVANFRGRKKWMLDATGEPLYPQVLIEALPGMQLETVALGDDITLMMRRHPGGGRVRIDLAGLSCVEDLYVESMDEGYYLFKWEGATWSCSKATEHAWEMIQ